MNTLDLITVIFLATIAILSGLISYQFYLSKNGRLRLILIFFFATKVVLYGASAYILLFSRHVTPLQRLILNTPMLIVMLELYRYIRLKK